MRGEYWGQREGQATALLRWWVPRRALPMALGLGAGGEARRPLGLAVVGGLVVSQLLTLYITPVVYIYMERFSSGAGWFRRRKRGGRMDAHPVLQK
jgi:AcrB/AcrD/AcrF family